MCERRHLISEGVGVKMTMGYMFVHGANANGAVVTVVWVGRKGHVGN